MATGNLNWYVLKVVGGKENKVREYIESALTTSSLFREYVSQVLIPTEKVVALQGGKRVVKEHNLLPSYVLVECNLTRECYPLLRNIPYVLGFLSEDKVTNRPTPVSQAEINKIVGNIDESAIQSQLDEIFNVGDKVKVADGPFSGFSGVIEMVYNEKRRLKVIVTIFERETSLELGFNQVERE